MTDPAEFSFDDNSVATAYDRTLAKVLFEPWADHLLEDYKPWAGKRVLDLATGSGVVAQRLSEQVGAGGSVVAADINGEMLELARERCNDASPAVEFVLSPAHPLDVPTSSVDTVICQQGFQFFPDKDAGAAEVHRVLRSEGYAIATTWRPVSECEFFGAICGALEATGEAEIANLMRIPFDFLPEDELLSAFESAGFANVRHKIEEHILFIPGGIDHAVEVAYSTPIQPKLQELSEQKQAQFKEKFSQLLTDLSPDGKAMGRMVSNVVTALK